jgi:hypothetical protein
LAHKSASSLGVTSSLSVLHAGPVSLHGFSDPSPSFESNLTRVWYVEPVGSQFVDPEVFPVPTASHARMPRAVKSAHGVTPPAELDHQQATAIICCSFAVPLMRFDPLQHIQEQQVHSSRALPRSVRSVFRVSHPLDGFLPADPAGYFSSRKHSWGSPLQSFFLTSKPYAPLDARNPPDVGKSTRVTRSVDRTAAVVRGHLDFRCIRTAWDRWSVARLQGLSPRWSSSPVRRRLAAEQVRCSPGVPASSRY